MSAREREDVILWVKKWQVYSISTHIGFVVSLMHEIDNNIHGDTYGLEDRLGWQCCCYYYMMVVNRERLRSPYTACLLCSPLREMCVMVDSQSWTFLLLLICLHYTESHYMHMDFRLLSCAIFFSFEFFLTLPYIQILWPGRRVNKTTYRTSTTMAHKGSQVLHTLFIIIIIMSISSLRLCGDQWDSFHVARRPLFMFYVTKTTKHIATPSFICCMLKCIISPTKTLGFKGRSCVTWVGCLAPVVCFTESYITHMPLIAFESHTYLTKWIFNILKKTNDLCKCF